MNIVFIQCDSMDGRMMSCMDHPAMKGVTPNMERLKQKGVMFKNAYSNNPICVPSRSSMWSGKFTHNCEGWNNYKGLEENSPTFETKLKENGYVTQTYGKTDYLSGHHTDRARVTAWLRSAEIMRPTYNIKTPVIIDEMEKRVHHTDWETIDNGINWIRDNHRSQKPFMLYLGLNSPHPAFRTSRYYYDLIDKEKIDIPPIDGSRHPSIEYQKIQKNWQHGFSDDIVKEVRHTYFAMIAEVDAMLGEVLLALDEMGLDNSTYIIFTSDHGELAMEHQQYFKMSLYEGSVRVPLIISGPGIVEDKTVNDLTSLVDIYPTLMDLCGIYKPLDLDGQSLLPELKGEDGNRRQWVISECHDSTCNTGFFMLRQGDWKYNKYVGYESQLFNLKDDPHEIINLADTDKEKAEEMDTKLRNIVDYEAVDAKVKAYDKSSFIKWREEQKRNGTYEKRMALIHSGFDNVHKDDIIEWSRKDEDKINKWLSSNKDGSGESK